MKMCKVTLKVMGLKDVFFTSSTLAEDENEAVRLVKQQARQLYSARPNKKRIMFETKEVETLQEF